MGRVTYTTSHDTRNAWMALCAMTKKSEGGSTQIALKGKSSPYDDKITRS